MRYLKLNPKVLYKNDVLFLFSLFLLTATLVNCSNKQVRPENYNFKNPNENAEKKETVGHLVDENSNFDLIQGTCMFMNPPGISESLFTPCNHVGLQLLYQKDKQTIIFIIRTQSDGKFELSIPKKSSWYLSSTSTNWHTEVEIITNPNNTKKIVVVLKPEKPLQVHRKTKKIPSKNGY